MKIVFIGIHNKEGLKPLDSSTDSGKRIDAIIANLKGTECIKANLFDVSYMPLGVDAKAKAKDFVNRIGIQKEDVAVCLGKTVYDYLAKNLKCTVLKVPHPSPMTMIYSPQHQGLVLAPLMVKPDKSNGIFWDEYKPETGEWDFNKDMFNAHMGHYNTWLSSPPIYKVRPEDIEWFSVERGEDEFEVDSSACNYANSRCCGYDKEKDNCECWVAIPKKGNESKEQSPSVEPDFENDPYWVGQAYLQDKQLLEIEKMFDDNGLRLELTCSACPEQYDVFLKVGYLRLRHGEFRVDYPDCGGKTIYEAEPNGDGIFNKDERVKYMEEAMKAILKMLNKDKNVKVSDTTGDASSKNAD